MLIRLFLGHHVFFSPQPMLSLLIIFSCHPFQMPTAHFHSLNSLSYFTSFCGIQFYGISFCQKQGRRFFGKGVYNSRGSHSAERFQKLKIVGVGLQNSLMAHDKTKVCNYYRQLQYFKLTDTCHVIHSIFFQGSIPSRPKLVHPGQRFFIPICYDTRIWDQFITVKT